MDCIQAEEKKFTICYRQNYPMDGILAVMQDAKEATRRSRGYQKEKRLEAWRGRRRFSHRRIEPELHQPPTPAFSLPGRAPRNTVPIISSN